VYKEKKIFIITDDIVSGYYLDTVINSLDKDYEVDYVIVPHGEESKNINVYADCCEKLISKGIRRNYLLLALGGGVIGDLTGFIASTLFRGLPYVGVPTSLLAQMDSSIGGKTGIDFNGRKNIIGAFKQPLMVLIDPNTLNTLEKCEFNNGMGELIKHAIIGNEELYKKLVSKTDINEDVIYESLSVKKRVVELDPFDQKERMLLNFGHTFGHAIELKMGFKHGEAVSVGMLMAIKFGIDLGLTDAGLYDSIKSVLESYDLPIVDVDYHEYLKETLYDKKNLAGVVNFILVDKIGSAFIHKVKEGDLV
jgi:3-dehydroquinate synthase